MSSGTKWFDEALIAAAQRCANAYAKIANKLYGCSLPIPVPLSFDLQDRKPKGGGEASRGEPHISLNMILYRDYVERALNEFLPHEIAHLMQFDKFDNKGFPTRGHGPEWKEAMRRIGKEPVKYMTEDVDISKSIAHYKALKKKTKRVPKDDS